MIRLIGTGRVFRLQHPLHQTVPRSSLTRSFLRYKSSPAEPTPPSEAKDATTTIPGPSYLWMESVQAPFKHYSRLNNKSPYWTQFVSVLVIYLIADLTAQVIAIRKPSVEEPADESRAKEAGEEIPGPSYDPLRTARSLVIGGACAVPSYIFFLRLGNMFPTLPTPIGITLKVLINQFTYTPLFNIYFFGSQSLLSGQTIQDTVERLKDTVPQSWKNSWKVWPAVTAISFLWLKVEFRQVFAGVVAIGWQAYLSLLNSKSAKKEDSEHLGQALEKKTEIEHDAKKRAVTA
ncbi:hypothetical protein K402DRAFT_395700 [Aulographum hederae CBS 113979]|uniref:Uncharacterized protein n=1 Tax=Aulographum hederae CBS 113979 TaxID=1176131 RepID=A0A6G1GU70_9PEZI|nr:hypothetical protein K402DRAFT_395700 [Aulographum hederae CBS 113979]